MKLGMTSERAILLNSPLSSHQLVIEPLNAGHAEAFFPLMQDEDIYRWISSLPPRSIDQLSIQWKRRETRINPEGTEAWLNWAARRVTDGMFVGKLDAVVNAENIATNVGYFFFPQYWGKGYASESVLEMCNHLAANGVSEQRATVTLGNLPSYRVLEKAGFRRSRIIPENDTIRGIKHDDVEFVRTDEI